MRIPIKVEYDEHRLTMTVDDDDRKELQALKDEKNADGSDAFSSNDTTYEVFEWLQGNSEFHWIPPHEIGALTDAPILGIYEEDPANPGELKVVHAWGFMAYEVRSPQDDLLEKGKAVFVSRS